MRIFRFVVLLTLVFLPVKQILAQEISVDGFRLLENDLTANTFGTTEYDQNGQVAALIKVVTIETGFVFDAGMMGIVKTVQQAGEIWVYVPFGLQRITIAHPELGILRDYYFPISIDKARTYELRLRTVRPERAGSNLTPNVNVTFDNVAEKSGIYLNGAFIGTGGWSGLVAANTYVLEVKQEGFETYSTTITIEPDEPEQTISIPTLEPVKGQIMANSIPSNAIVYMDGVLKGKSPLLIDGLVAGTYNLEFRQRGYVPYTTAVSVKTEETYKADAILKRVNNNVYAGAGYQIGHLSGIAAFAGIYLWNYNLEVGYLKHSTPTQQTSWLSIPTDDKGAPLPTGVASLVEYEFTLKDVLSGSIGYGIPLGKGFCVAAGIGAAYYRIEGECSYKDSYLSADNDFSKASTYTLSGMVTGKIEYSPIKYVSLTVSPAYEIPISKGSLATTIDENTEIIRNWCSGLSVKAGIKFYY